MMQKLELTWIGKGQEPALEPRILLHDPSKDYGDPNATNMLIHGDNLLALKALEQDFAGQVKCIYIDPPYNINVANPHYNDNAPHSDYISLMKRRIEILHHLLHDEGSLWISINSDELFYLKIVCDEVFGEKNFVTVVTLKTATTASYRSINVCPVNVSEYILVYAKDAQQAEFRPVYIPVDYSEDYGSYIENMDDSPENWVLKKLDDLIYDEVGVSNWREFRDKYGDAWKEVRYSMKREKALAMANCVVSLNTLQKPANDVARLIERSKSERDQFFVYERDGKEPIIIYNGRTLAFYSSKLKNIGGTLTPSDILTNIWTDISYLSLGLEGGVKFPNSKKPERLIERILSLGSNEGDLVLDSFLGSGTTAAVAHKMGRRWIGIELGDHCYTHCLPRLKAVVDGEQSGISKAVGWKGGGGFKFYELAPTLIVKDENGFEIISDQYDATMLAAAVAKLCGYRFAPREDNPYIHGVNNVGGFIFVTTQYITAPLLGEIAKHFSDTQSLVICASAFQVGIKNNFPNIKLRKIPQSVLSKCEYGADNYNLNVVELPDFEETEEDFEDAE
jgi:adenine-specific DNA-methyltransferase